MKDTRFSSSRIWSVLNCSFWLFKIVGEVIDRSHNRPSHCWRSIREYSRWSNFLVLHSVIWMICNLFWIIFVLFWHSVTFASDLHSYMWTYTRLILHINRKCVSTSYTHKTTMDVRLQEYITMRYREQSHWSANSMLSLIKEMNGELVSWSRIPQVKQAHMRRKTHLSLTSTALFVIISLLQVVSHNRGIRNHSKGRNIQQ